MRCKDEKNFFRNFVKEIDKDNGRITLGIDLPDDVNFKFDLSQQLSATHKLQIGASIIDAYNGLRRNTMAKERAVQLNIKSGLEWLFRLKL